MNKFVFLLTFLTCFTAQAEQLKVNGTLRCVRKIIEQRQVDEQILVKTQSIFYRVQKNELENLEEECKSILATTEDRAPLKKNEVDELLWKVQAARALHRLNDPGMKCVVGGISAEAAFIVGGGLGIHVGQCHSESGRVFAVISPTPFYSVGIGAMVFAEKLKFYIGPEHISTKFEGNSAAIIFADEDDGGRPARTIGFGDHHITIGGPKKTQLKGYGVGLGITTKEGRNFVFKLAPLGNDFSFVLAN